MWQKLKNYYHLVGAVIANVIYGFPSRNVKMIGVTGTDGKTTTTHLIYHILKSSGRKVSMSSSVYADIAGTIQDTGLHVTTQSHRKIQKNIRSSMQKGYEYFVLETTSHSIDQYRIWGIAYEIGVLTNVTHEHLDYHKNYETYLATKAKLLLASKKAIINRDDQSYEKMREILESNAKEFASYSLSSREAQYIWNDDMQFPYDQDYNRQNAMAAYAACRELGLTDEEIYDALKTFKLPKGRFEIAYDKDFKVIIDFAHTPHSIEQLLKSTQQKNNTRSSDHGRGWIIHVFGSAGLRDRSKRAEMGKASGKYANVVIITEEDYRTESFDDISESISKGLIEKGFTEANPSDIEQGLAEKSFVIIQDRAQAVEAAIKLAQKGDTVVFTGKGHEKSLARGTKEYDWDELKAVQGALQKFGYIS